MVFQPTEAKPMLVNVSKKTAPAALLAMTLAACGGGGGGGTSAPNTSAPVVITSFPVQQALGYAYTHGLQSSLTITGTTSNGSTVIPLTGTLTYTLGAATNPTFNGVAALQATETISGTLSGAGTTQPLTIVG